MSSICEQKELLKILKIYNRIFEKNCIKTTNEHERSVYHVLGFNKICYF